MSRQKNFHSAILNIGLVSLLSLSVVQELSAQQGRPIGGLQSFQSTPGFGVLDYQGNPYNRLTNPALNPYSRFQNPLIAPGSKYPFGASIQTYNFHSLYAPQVSQFRYYGTPGNPNFFPQQGFPQQPDPNFFQPQGFPQRPPVADPFGNNQPFLDLNRPNKNFPRPKKNGLDLDLLKVN